MHPGATSAGHPRSHLPKGDTKLSWFPCHCGHTTDHHYLSGTQRHGPCKAADCSCPVFQATGHPPVREGRVKAMTADPSAQAGQRREAEGSVRGQRMK